MLTFKTPQATVGPARALCLVAALLLAMLHEGCRPLPAQPAPRETPASRDSVRRTGRLVYDLIRLIDRVGRPAGRPPNTLAPVVEQFTYVQGTDLWGRTFEYHVQGQHFEVSSPGPDGVSGNADDIVGRGRLGLIDPCYMRDQYRVWVDDHSAACTDHTPIVLLLPCERVVPSVPRETPPRSAADTVMGTGRRLVALARALDAYARDHAGLPKELSAAFGTYAYADWWGSPIRYRPAGRDFEVRSAGADREFDTADDLVAAAVIGRTIRCEFRSANGIETCPDPPPPCPGREVRG